MADEDYDSRSEARYETSDTDARSEAERDARWSGSEDRSRSEGAGE